MGRAAVLAKVPFFSHYAFLVAPLSCGLHMSARMSQVNQDNPLLYYGMICSLGP